MRRSNEKSGLHENNLTARCYTQGWAGCEWVNAAGERGLPYDVLLTADDGSRTHVEVCQSF